MARRIRSTAVLHRLDDVAVRNKRVRRVVLGVSSSDVASTPSWFAQGGRRGPLSIGQNEQVVTVTMLLFSH